MPTSGQVLARHLEGVCSLSALITEFGGEELLKRVEVHRLYLSQAFHPEQSVPERIRFELAQNDSALPFTLYDAGPRESAEVL